MITSHLSAHADTAARQAQPKLGGERSFEAALRAAGSGADREQAESQVREAAKGLVASAFLIPMLASLRENSQGVGPYAPTTAERRFGPVVDQQVADQVMKGTNFALIDSIVDRYMKGAQR